MIQPLADFSWGKTLRGQFGRQAVAFDVGPAGGGVGVRLTGGGRKELLAQRADVLGAGGPIPRGKRGGEGGRFARRDG